MTMFAFCNTLFLFIGYALEYKGYRCFDPTTKKVYTGKVAMEAEGAAEEEGPRSMT